MPSQSQNTGTAQKSTGSTTPPAGCRYVRPSGGRPAGRRRADRGGSRARTRRSVAQSPTAEGAEEPSPAALREASKVERRGGYARRRFTDKVSKTRNRVERDATERRRQAEQRIKSARPRSAIGSPLSSSKHQTSPPIGGPSGPPVCLGQWCNANADERPDHRAAARGIDELHRSIVDLGMVRSIDVKDGGRVEVVVSLTTPGCRSAHFQQAVTQRVSGSMEWLGRGRLRRTERQGEGRPPARRSVARSSPRARSRRSRT